MGGAVADAAAAESPLAEGNGLDMAAVLPLVVSSSKAPNKKDSSVSGEPGEGEGDEPGVIVAPNFVL